ncbi:MAG: membrane protein required for colicin V production [Candidatus Tokpelaia sp. JSC085]|nr:MAG: membrane protein required for colicin V production [Candidatus Tokpelaia sp. JSC085]
MPMMTLDGLVILVTLLSAFLAMIRGFSRELLSLFSWILAGVFACLFYNPVLPLLEQYISNNTVALIATISLLFLVVLISLSIITMKMSDFILDSRIGALDRTLGFVFGMMRGLFILAIMVLFLNGLIKTTNHPSWIANAKTKPMLDTLGNQIWSLIPPNLLQQLNKQIYPENDIHHSVLHNNQ